MSFAYDVLQQYMTASTCLSVHVSLHAILCGFEHLKSRLKRCLGNAVKQMLILSFITLQSGVQYGFGAAVPAANIKAGTAARFAQCEADSSTWSLVELTVGAYRHLPREMNSSLYSTYTRRACDEQETNRLRLQHPHATTSMPQSLLTNAASSLQIIIVPSVSAVYAN